METVFHQASLHCLPNNTALFHLSNFMVFYTVPGDYLQKPHWLSLLKVFGQGLGPREVAQGQEFALIYMCEQGFPGQQPTSHGLRCYHATGRDSTKFRDKTLRHEHIYFQSMVIVWYTFPGLLVSHSFVPLIDKNNIKIGKLATHNNLIFSTCN